MWLCSHCETTNQDASETCDVCGTSRTPPVSTAALTPSVVPTTAATPSRSSGRPIPYWTGCLGVLVVLCIVGAIGLGGLWTRNGQTYTPSPVVSKSTPYVEEMPSATGETSESLPSNVISSPSKPTVESEDTPIVVTDFDWSRCHAKYTTRLKGGDYVIISEFSSPFGYHVLEGPYKDRKAVGEIQAGNEARIMGGPSCSGGWIWWIIESDGTRGWFPEGDADTYWLSPVNQEADARSATISHEIHMVSLRRTPGFLNKSDNDVIVEIPEGERVIIISGPSKADGLNWWYVAWNGYEGWMAERTASGKVILLFNP